LFSSKFLLVKPPLVAWQWLEHPRYFGVDLIALSKWLMSIILSPGPESGTQCELSPVNASHPVQALMESFTVLSGCASRGTTGLPQEVHVLNLRNTDEGPDQLQREVGAGVGFQLHSLRLQRCFSEQSSFFLIWGSASMLMCEHKDSE
jgi:hypothetical protein